MAKTGYVKTVLTGGGASALDGISGAVLLDGDFAFVGVGNLAYFYILDADSAAAESSPDIIAPDATPGNKRWILQNYLSNGFVGVSTTELTVGTGSKTLTVQTNKGFVVGMSVKIAYTTTPTTWMHGDITSYTPATGELIVTVGTVSGSGTQSAWTVSMSGADASVAFVNPTKMYFYQNTAPVGWTIDAAVADGLLAVKGGAQAYNVSGGALAGTWSPTGHTHTGPSHTHTGPSHTHTGPSHAHTTPGHVLTVAEMPAHTHPSSARDPATARNVDEQAPSTTVADDGTATGSTGGGASHAHGNTGAEGTGATSSDGTAATGASGTAATGSSSEANTYRPYAAVGIIATKDA